MSKAWLEGKLSGVEPRSELELLRQAAVEGLDRGEDLTPMVVALANLDPVACAELVAGPRAPAHPGLVRAALAAAAPLETVLPPAGLYRRLADLAPGILDEVIRAAGARHGEAPWIWRLSAGESPPGRTALALAAESDSDRAPYLALDNGCRRAVVERAGTGDPASLRALYALAPRESLLVALSAALAAPGSADLVAWVAGWHGPEVDPMFAAVARRLTSLAAKERLTRLAWALPETLEVLQ